MKTPKTVEEVVAEFKREFEADRGYGNVPQYVGAAFDISDYTDWLRTTLTAQNQAADERLREVLEEIADEIPEAYGWGEEDDEADRGYRICSKNVKAMIRKRAAKHGITNL